MNENQLRYLLQLVLSDIGKQQKAIAKAKPTDHARGYDKDKFVAAKTQKIEFASGVKSALEDILHDRS